MNVVEAEAYENNFDFDGLVPFTRCRLPAILTLAWGQGKPLLSFQCCAGYSDTDLRAVFGRRVDPQLPS